MNPTLAALLTAIQEEEYKQMESFVVKDAPVLRDVEYVRETGQFVVKDSGKREQFESGMVRDTTEGKVDYTLVLDGPMFKRWAEHLTKGAVKYKKRNWMQANGEAEYDRFRESALRHFLQWIEGDRDEDHAAAVMFNINGAEYVANKLVGQRIDKIYDECKKETE